MARKIFFLALIILGSSIFSFQGESRATITSNSASGSQNADKTRRQPPPYRILKSRYVMRSSLKRTVGYDNGVRIRFLQNGIDNTEIEDLNIAYESGTQFRLGNAYGIENYSLPLYVRVTYKAWNAFHAVQSDVEFEFVIMSPGTWDVNIWN